jgi:predicted Ser/Thr protein kinase
MRRRTRKEETMGVRIDPVPFEVNCEPPATTIDLLKGRAIARAFYLALMRLGAHGRRWCLPILAACVIADAFVVTAWIGSSRAVSSGFLVLVFCLLLTHRLLGIACAVPLLVSKMATSAPRAPRTLASEPTPFARSMAMNLAASMSRRRNAEPPRGIDTPCARGHLEGRVLDGHYELQELIGRGGMGEVYRGRKLDDGWMVAIKVLHAHLCDQVEARERFRREASLASRLPITLVPEVIEYGTTADGMDYIVMEYLRGEDLACMLERRGRLPIDEVIRIIDKIAAALEAAHAVGIVHRDLKPENVFLGDEGDDVRLLDFGIARLREGDGLTLATELLGTPGYIAPEQARGDASQIGPHTDVFALGSIAYRALTGRCAFPSRQTYAAAYEAMHLTPVPPSSLVHGLEEDVDHVIALALAKTCADRYPRPSWFAEGLRLAAHAALDATSRASARRLAAAQEQKEPWRVGSPLLH